MGGTKCDASFIMLNVVLKTIYRRNASDFMTDVVAAIVKQMLLE